MTAMNEFAWHEHARHLARKLADGGVAEDDVWLQAVREVPRHVFIPEFYCHTGAPGEEVTGTRFTAAIDGYLEAAYSDDVLAIQHIEHDGWAWVTSSSTAPSLMLRMLRELDAHPGMTVLEIGTGAGYNAALLSHRLGDTSVTSIDIDPELIRLARQRLADAGYQPALAVGDGRAGFPGRAPYDRLIATVAFDEIPAAWLQQARPGAIIVCDLRPAGAVRSGALARLTVRDDGTATGRLLDGDAGFMSARSDVTTPGSPGAATIDKMTVCGRSTNVAGNAVLTPGLALVIWRRLPGLTIYPGADTVTIVAADSSWAEISRTSPDRLSYGGPDDVWANVERASAWWHDQGRPSIGRFGVTATPDGTTTWLDTPDQLISG